MIRLRASRVLPVLLPLVGLLCGCPVTQPQETPVPEMHVGGSSNHAGYWLYVPSNYTPDRTWPLVITLHGTHGWDSASAQIREWKALAQEKGIIVAAPQMRSVQGILPVVRSLWQEDLAKDDQSILAVMDELQAKYRIDNSRVLLTGFSAGGYPMYNTGLRHPDRFCMLAARSCNTDMPLLESIPLTDQARKMPVVIFWGHDDFGLGQQCWKAVEFLSNHDFKKLTWQKVKGGHLRRPDLAYSYWRPLLPKELQR